MPRKRLPWFKVWVGATRHEKVATLDDKTFRAWVELLDAASQQTVRGHFASTDAAASVIRRPVATVRVLIQAHLIDQTADGAVQMHDWPEWQRWQPQDDGADPDPPPEPSANGSGRTPESLAKDSRKTRESPEYSNGMARENPVIDTGKPSRGAERAKTEKGDGDVDVEERRETGDGTPSATTSPSPRGAAAASRIEFTAAEQDRINAVAAVLGPLGLAGDLRFWRKVLDSYGQLDMEAEAFKQADWMRRNRIKACSTSRYLHWLDKALEDHASRALTANIAAPMVCAGCGAVGVSHRTGGCPAAQSRLATG